MERCRCRNERRRRCPGAGQARNLYAGGGFTTAGDVPANNIAKWDRTTSSWSTLGAGVNGGVGALALDGHGNLYAGGDFTTAGGVAAKYIAKWEGPTSSWSALGTGMNSGVGALALDRGGNLYAGGPLHHRWRGNRYRVHQVGWYDFVMDALGSGTNGDIRDVAADGEGSLYAAGGFTAAGNKVSLSIGRWTTADGQALSGPGAYTFYADNLPLTIIVPPGGQGDLARSTSNASTRATPTPPPRSRPATSGRSRGWTPAAGRPRAIRLT